MKTFLLRLFHTMASTLRERVHLALEVMALRHQLAVLARSGKRPHFSPVDRCFWVLLSTMWARWTVALAIVQADTVRRWRRQGLWRSLRWWPPGKRPGRSTITAETRAMIRRLSQENALWGAPRFMANSPCLACKVSRTTVATYMSAPTWSAVTDLAHVAAQPCLRAHCRWGLYGHAHTDPRSRRPDDTGVPTEAMVPRGPLTRDGVVPVLRRADVLTPVTVSDAHEHSCMAGAQPAAQPPGYP